MKYYEQYNNHTDNQILEILKKRKDYQDAAVEAAVQIAMERQLIHSEQDLFSSEFQIVQSKESRFFPDISNAYQRQKLSGSIFRFIYILSLVPLVYALLKYGEGEMNLTYTGIATGLIWFLFSFLLNRTRNVVLFIPLFILLLSISLVIGVKIFFSNSFRYLDLVMLLIGTMLPFYLLLLLRKLILTKPEN